MAWRVDKKCAFPRCSVLVSGPDVYYCPTHDAALKKSWDMNRETSVERGYTHRWSKVRAMKLDNDPLCEDCKAEGITKVADMVHHIDGDSRHNSMDNLRSLCWFHHGKYA